MRSQSLVFPLALLFAVLVLATATSAIFVDSDGPKPLLSQTLMQEIKAKAKGQWTASTENGRTVRHITRSEAQRLMGVRSLDNSALPPRQFTVEEKEMDIPDSFDSAENWPECGSISEIRDQSNCGSCWAIAAAEAMSDRYCIGAKMPEIRISTANLLSCCFMCGMGCNGGWPSAAWTWWNWMGLSTESCQPYPFPPCGHHTHSDRYPACPSTIYDTPTCNSTCSEGTQPMTKYKGRISYSISGESAYQMELMTNGPFEVAFDVYDDFVGYKSGIYSYTSGSRLGGHAVRIVGWGVENGVKYWKIANSWNEDWGEEGYFRIQRGNNECGIEQSGVAGLAQAP